MTSALTSVRKDLSDALNELGFRTTVEIPQTFTPPLCWVAPRQPYRVPGQTFSRKRIALSVVCLAANGTNAVALAAAEDMAESVADAIDAMTSFRLDTEEIDAPQMFPTAQGQNFLGAVVNVLTEISRA